MPDWVELDPWAGELAVLDFLEARGQESMRDQLTG